MRLKKCLLTSLSLGLTGITIGAIVSSCASPAAEATDPNPASANSISTNPGDPLTPEQQDYQQKLAAEIKVQFDANAKLDYSIPADKANIDSQIAEYDKELTTAKLGQLATKTNELINSPVGDSTISDELQKMFSDFYENFKQKNLIATESEMNEYFAISNKDDNASLNWKFKAGEYAAFYSNPKAFILLKQLLTISTRKDVNSFYLSVAVFTETSTFFNKTRTIAKDDITSSIKAINYYSDFLKNDISTK